MSAPADSPRLIRVLEHDPDLAHRLSETDAHLAARQTVGVLEHVETGPWRPVTIASGKCLFGGLLLDGLLVREVALGSSVSAELVGAGDLVLPHDADDTTPFVNAEPTWTALEETRVAWLDSPFAVAVRRWPELGAALLERSERRFERLAVMQAIGQLTRVEDRVLTLLWHLAERWGRMTTAGVVLPVKLTHRVIARLVGARRPSVTTAIGALERSGRLERRDDGAWLLQGTVPEALAEMRPQRAPWKARGGEPALIRVPTADEPGFVPPIAVVRPSASLLQREQRDRVAQAVERARFLQEQSRLIARRMQIRRNGD